MKTLAFFFALMVPAFARLGETVDECRTRYGKESSVDEKLSMMEFRKAGFRLMITFDAGRAAYMFINHDPTNDFIPTNPEITDAEIETLLKSNGGGSEWVERKDFDMISKTWDTKDGKRIAIYDTLKHNIMIVSVDYGQKMAEKRKLEQKQNLDGF